MQITKMDGTVEEFDVSKLEQSLRRSGASSRAIREIVDHIQQELYEGVTTTKIYRHAHKLLEKYDVAPEVSFRYSLRRAISEFGPSGFPFEKFVGEIFRLQGYRVQVGKKIKGRCVSHEMDVIGLKDDEVLTAELKFHNKLTIKSDLKTVLYVRARFDDLIAAGYYGDKKQRLAIITNTKFSSNAARYGECAGMELIGWNHPRREGNLHDLIITSGIHPLTCLSTLTKKQKQYFLDQGLVLCRELSRENARVLREAKHMIPKSKIPKIIEEMEIVCRCVGPSCGT